MKKTILIAMFLIPFFGFSQTGEVKDQATYQYNKIDNPNSSETEFIQNYSSGIAYYNRAVTVIQNIDYETDLLTLAQISDQCIELFKTAFPFLEKCYKENATDKNTLKALSGIYFAMNELDKHQKIEKELAAIK